MITLREAAVIALLMLAGVVQAQSPMAVVTTLRGTVRADNSAEPIAVALVQLLDAPRHAYTNSQGEYRLDISAGLHRLLISRAGYASRELSVVAGSDSVIRIDIMLEPKPVQLHRLIVRTNEMRDWKGSLAAIDADRELGERRLRPRDDPASSDADALAPATSTPDGVGSGPERGAALHIRGGSSDQNLVLLDGVPLYQPYHMVGAMSTLNPDAVLDARLHAGIPSSRLGGALSSVIELRSRDGDPGRWTTAGALASGLARLTITGPVPGVSGSFVLSGRTSTRDVPGFSSGGSNTVLGIGDVLGKASIPVRGGVLQFLSLVTTDHVGFLATVDRGLDSASSPAAGREPFADPAPAAGPSERNRFDRTGSTLAVVWHGDEDQAVQTGGRMWRSGGVTSGDWHAPAGAVRLLNEMRSVGASADAAWSIPNGRMAAGIQVERVRARYEVATALAGAATSSALTPAPAFSLGADRTLASLFVETHWRPDPWWSVTIGVRDQLAAGLLDGLEPRLAVRFRATSWLSLAASAGRVHQPLQTLSNGESIFDALLGGTLPVVPAGPIARADRVDVGAAATLGRHATLTLDAYANRLDALALVAPATAQPFAIDRIARARGRASGILLGLNYQSERVTAHAAYALSVTERAADGVRYAPAVGDPQSFSAAAAYQLRTRTFVRAAVWAAGGRKTTLTAGDLEWSPAPLTRGDDLAGGPRDWLGALGAETLPSYVRVDLGVRHAWEIGVGARRLRVTGAVNILNALDRANVRGVVVPAGTVERRLIPLLPRTLTVGLEWAY